MNLPTQKMQRFRTREGRVVNINLLQVGAVLPAMDEGNTGCTLFVHGRDINVQEESSAVVRLIDTAFASFHRD